MRFHSLRSDCKIAYMRYSSIAKFVEKSITFVRKMCIEHEKQLRRPKHYPLRKRRDPKEGFQHQPYTRYKLLPRHIAFLTSDDTLRDWANKNLDERCQLFHRKFPETRIYKGRLSRFYQAHKIRKKKLRLTKILTKK